MQIGKISVLSIILLKIRKSLTYNGLFLNSN